MLMVHALSGSGRGDPVPDGVVDEQQRSVKVPIRRFSFYVLMSVVHSPLAQNESATVKGLGNAGVVSYFHFETSLAIFLSGLGAIAVCWTICCLSMKQRDRAARLRKQAQAEKDASLEPVFSKLSGPFNARGPRSGAQRQEQARAGARGAIDASTGKKR